MHLLCLGSPPRHGSGTGGQHISPVLSVCPELEGELHRCVSSGLATWRDPVILMIVEEGYDTSVTCQSQQLGVAPHLTGSCRSGEPEAAPGS